MGVVSLGHETSIIRTKLLKGYLRNSVYAENICVEITYQRKARFRTKFETISLSAQCEVPTVSEVPCL